MTTSSLVIRGGDGGRLGDTAGLGVADGTDADDTGADDTEDGVEEAGGDALRVG
jgi:hypothetical protein